MHLLRPRETAQGPGAGRSLEGWYSRHLSLLQNRDGGSEDDGPGFSLRTTLCSTSLLQTTPISLSIRVWLVTLVPSRPSSSTSLMTDWTRHPLTNLCWRVEPGEIPAVFTDSPPVLGASLLRFSPQVFVAANSKAVLRLVNVQRGTRV